MDKASVVPCTSYDVVVGYGLLDAIPDDLVKYVPASKYAIITDQNVDRIYGARLRAAFDKSLDESAAEVLSCWLHSTCIALAWSREMCVIADIGNRQWQLIVDLAYIHFH